MIQYDYSEALKPDYKYPWIQRRLEALYVHFRNFLTSDFGRLYVLFGGERVGKTTLLKAIHHRPIAPERRCLPVFVDLKGLSLASETFFKLLFDEICKQHNICYYDHERAAEFFKRSEQALSDFVEALDTILRSADSLVQGAAHFVILLDNVDASMSGLAGKQLFQNLVNLFSNVVMANNVTRQFDMIVAGGPLLYDSVLQVMASDPDWLLDYGYNIGTLPDDAARALIAAGSAVQEHSALAESILHYTGGHPYLLQYFMAQLMSRTATASSITQADVESVAMDCLHPRSRRDRIAPWFNGYMEMLKRQESYHVYAELALKGVLTWREIETIVQALPATDSTSDVLTRAGRALDILLFHGLVYESNREEYRITGELFRKWFVDHRPSSEELVKPDAYTSYEAGLRRLLDQVGKGHPQYEKILVFQQRLLENIATARLYNDTDTLRSDRAQIIAQLDNLTLDTLAISFSRDLCGLG